MIFHEIIILFVFYKLFVKKKNQTFALYRIKPYVSNNRREILCISNNIQQVQSMEYKILVHNIY